MQKQREAAIAAYENRQSGTQDTLAEFMRLAAEYANAAREQDQMDLDNNAYAVYTILRNVIEDVNPEQARAVNQIFEQFPDYRWDNQQGSQSRIMLYRTLEPTVGRQNIIETANKLLRLERV